MNTTANEVCPSCGHAVARHYTDPTGVIRCMVVTSGVSTRGVIGLPWSESCDCANWQATQKPPKEEQYVPKIEFTEEETADFKRKIAEAMSGEGGGT